MADRNFSNVQAIAKQVKIVAGSAAFNSSGVIGTQNFSGASVARTGTGAYTITLTDVYPALVGANIIISKATAADLVPQINSVNLSSKTISFRLLTGATPTDLAEAGSFYVTLIFKNTTLAP